MDFVHNTQREGKKQTQRQEKRLRKKKKILIDGNLLFTLNQVGSCRKKLSCEVLVRKYSSVCFL